MIKVIAISILCCFLVSCTPKVAPPLHSSDTTSQINQDTTPRNQTSDNQKSLYTIPIATKSFSIDKLNQLYLVTNRNEVIKFDSKGKEVFRYNNNFLDNLKLVDATNPFNILLYYPDYFSAITLDRTMNQNGEFDLSNLNLFQTKAVGSSNDKNLWLYDEVAFKLKKINRSGMVLRESVDISLQINYSPKPIFLVERENMVYVNDPDYGILVFNNFGEYESLLELKDIEKFQVNNSRLFFKKGTKFFAYHLQSFIQKEILLPAKLESSDDILIGKNRIFVRKTNQVEVYEIEAG